jgi:hypothetical protein
METLHLSEKINRHQYQDHPDIWIIWQGLWNKMLELTIITTLKWMEKTKFQQRKRRYKEPNENFGIEKCNS